MSGSTTNFQSTLGNNDSQSPLFSGQSYNASDFHIYMLNERARTVPSPKYEHPQSIRIWLIDYEHQAKLHGVSNLDLCARYVATYMPLNIKNWLSRRPPPILAKWNLMKEDLISRFGVSEEVDNKRRLKDLKKCRKDPKQSIRLHATDFEYLLSLITENYTEDTKITMFIQSLDKAETRLSLIALQAALGLTTLDQIISKAIEVEDRARLQDQPQTQQEDDDNSTSPMDIDNFQKYSNKGKHRYHKKPVNHHSQQTTQLRAYDKDGKPICDLCRKSHRTIDCDQYKKNSYKKKHKKYNKGINNVEIHEQSSSTNNFNSASVSIAHLAKLTESKLPRTKLIIQQRPCISLWDTGAEISGISKTFTETIGVAINKNTSIPYRDVNGNINNTCGTVELTLGDIAFNVHVIEGLAHDLIIGWDTITALQGQVDAKTQSVTIRINDTTTTIPTIKDTQMISAIETQDKATENITNMILNEYKDVIAENPNKPKVTHLVEFEIDTGDHEPIFEKPRTFHPIMEQQINQRLEEMCQDGIMTKISFSRWASKVRPVEKPDGSTRICGNYVKLNEITTPIQYPFVNMHEALQSMGKAKIFTKIDLASGYYQIPIKESDKEKTTLVTKSGFYVFNVMSMGLKNAPMVFQNLMDMVLGVYRFSIAIAYLDDLIIFSSDLEEHIKHVRMVMDRLRFANLSIKLSKCQWLLPQIEYLGFILSSQGVQGNPDKIKSIINYPRPQNLQEVEQFLGMAGVYQRFISQYQIKTEPLRLLKKKDQDFIWEEKQQAAFNKLKEDLCLLQ